MPDAASSVRNAYLRTADALRHDTFAEINDLWRRGTAELTDASMRQFVKRAADVAEGAGTNVANATVGYLDALERVVTGRRRGRFSVPPAGGGAQALRGVEPTTLWARPVARIWRALGAGHSRERAIEIAGARMAELIHTGLQLAHTRTALGWFATSSVESYRRSLKGPCGMCVLAATETLEPDHPMPIHPHCACVVWPRFVGHGAMKAAGEPSAEAARGAVVELTGESDMTPYAYRRHLVIVEHGEIGPMLRRRGDHFTGPSEILTA